MKDFVKEKQQEAQELINDRKVINENKETNLSDLKIMKIMANTPIRDAADNTELITLAKAYLDENTIILNEQNTNQEKINQEISEIDDYKTDLEYNITVFQNIEKASDLTDTSKETASINKRIRDLDALKIVLGLGAMIDVNSTNSEYQKVHNPLSNPDIAIISQRTEQKNATIPEPIIRIIQDIDKQIPVKTKLNNVELNLNNDLVKLIHTEKNHENVKKTETEGVENCIETDAVLKSDENKQNIYQWINEINPNYDPFNVHSGYSTNCGSCALAVYQRLEGNNSTTATKENIDTIAEMKNITGMEQKTMKPDEIEEYLKSKGPGSHGIVGIDRAKGPGHWFNAYYDGKKVIAIDGQTGKIQPWPPNYGDVTKWDISVKP